MGDGNPPSSWYDPPEPKFEVEIKWERPVTDAKAKCDKCEEVAFMHVQVGDVRYRSMEFLYVCKNHYDSVLDDLIEEIENYEPDYEED